MSFFAAFYSAEYHLVVICSIENDKSNMVRTLDPYRRSFPPLTSLEGVQRYLKEKLVCTNQLINNTFMPATIVDEEKYVLYKRLFFAKH